MANWNEICDILGEKISTIVGYGPSAGVVEHSKLDLLEISLNVAESEGNLDKTDVIFSVKI